MSNENLDTDEAKGRVKQAAGTLTGNEELEQEGKLDRAVSDVKGAVDTVADKIRRIVRRDDR